MPDGVVAGKDAVVLPNEPQTRVDERSRGVLCQIWPEYCCCWPSA